MNNNFTVDKFGFYVLIHPFIEGTTAGLPVVQDGLHLLNTLRSLSESTPG